MIVPPLAEVPAKTTDRAPGAPTPSSLALTLKLAPGSVAVGVDGRAPTRPTASCVLPTALPNVSLPATGLTLIVVFAWPVQPKLSVTVMVTDWFSTVVVGVPDTTPVVAPIPRPAGRPLCLHA